MNIDKGAGELSNFITVLVGKTLEIVNKKIGSQLHFLNRECNVIPIQETVSNLIALYGSYNLMIAKSHVIYLQRKIIMAKKGVQGEVDKYNIAISDFWEHTQSVIGPLRYFAGIYDPRKPQKNSNNIESINDIIKELEKYNKMFHSKYVKSSTVKKISIGGDEYISGVAIDTLIARHRAQLREARETGGSEYIDEYAQCTKCGKDAVQHIIYITKMDKLYNSALSDWEITLDNIKRYLSERSNDDWDCSTPAECASAIIQIDIKHLLQFTINYIEELSAITTANALQLAEPPKTKQIPNRVRELHEISALQISSPHIPKNLVLPSGSNKLDNLERALKFEEQYQALFSDLENQFNNSAAQLERASEKISWFIRKGQIETCIRHVEKYISWIIYSNYAPVISNMYSFNIQFPEPDIILPYEGGYTQSKLEELINTIYK